MKKKLLERTVQGAFFIIEKSIKFNVYWMRYGLYNEEKE